MDEALPILAQAQITAVEECAKQMRQARILFENSMIEAKSVGEKRKLENMVTAAGEEPLPPKVELALGNHLIQFASQHYLVFVVRRAVCAVVLGLDGILDMMKPDVSDDDMQNQSVVTYTIKSGSKGEEAFVWATFATNDPDCRVKCNMQFSVEVDDQQTTYADHLTTLAQSDLTSLGKRRKQVRFETCGSTADTNTRGIYIWRVFEVWDGFDEDLYSQEDIEKNLVFTVRVVVT